MPEKIEAEIKEEANKVHKVETTEKAEQLAKSEYGVYFIDGDTNFEIDFSDSRGGAIYVTGAIDTPVKKGDLGKGYTKEVKSLVTKNIVVPSIGEKGVTFEVHPKSKMGAYSTAIYSRDTISLVQKKMNADALEYFFEENKDVEQAIVLTNISATIIGKAPENIKGLLNGKDLKDNPATKMSQAKHEKENLKAYETPTKTYTPLLRAMDKSMFKKFISKEASRKMKSDIYKKASFLAEVQDYFGGVSGLDANIMDSLGFCYSRIYQKHGDEVIEKQYGDEMTPYESKIHIGFRDILLANKSTKGMLDLIDTLFKEGMKGEGFMSNLGKKENKKKWKSAFGFSPPSTTIPIFDPQVGSGKGLLDAFDEANFNGKIKGLELRDSLKYEDNRISAIGGVSTSLYASTISDLFHSSQIKDATDNLFSYLNPPYTSDDSVARDTVDMYKNGMMFAGLFPTKMRNFLSNSMSKASLIMEIPRELTGYTDPKTPDRFLFVIGEKNSYDSHIKIHEGQTSGLFSGFNSGTPHVLSFTKDATPEMLQKALEVHIQQKEWTLGSRLYEMLKYYDKSDIRENIIYSRLVNIIRNQAEILENAGKLNEGLKNNQKSIMDKFMPVEVARKQKVFVDPRFYSEDGVYERFGFEDVSQNVPLLVYYRDNMPSIFGLIIQIAKEKGVSLPIDTAPTEPFVLGQKPTREKDIVTNMNLGMMKLNYYPSNIDLSDPESKELLLEIMIRVYKGEMSEERQEMLREAILLSDKMVIKSEKILRTDEESSQLLPKEVFVLLDSYGYDIGKLNMELDEFFRELEVSGLFDINDYIELAVLQTDKKRSILKGFIREMQSPIYAIAKHNNIDMEEMDKEVLKRGSDLFLKMAKKEITMDGLEGEILKFSEEYDLKGLFTNMFKIDNEVLISKMKSAISTSLTMLKKKTTDSLAEQIVDLFNDNPLRFYEDQKDATFDMLQESLVDIYGGDIDKLERDMLQFKEGVVEELTPFYRIHSNINVSYSRMAETLIYRYAILKQTYNEDLADSRVDTLYQNIIGNMFSSTLGLLPHQVREAEGFLSVSDEKDMEHLYAEMRSGKTRTFIATLFLLGLHKNKDITIILETANVPDITEQMLESFPFMAMNARYFGDPDKIATSMESSFENLISDNMYPVPYRIFTQSKVRGGGEAIAELNKTFGEDMRETKRVLENIYGKGEITRDKLLKDFPKSNFKKLLTFSC